MNSWHQYDDSDAVRAIQLYQQATRKTKTETLNRFTRNTAARAPRHIDKVRLSTINKHDPGRSSKRTQAPRLLYALAARDGHKKGRGIRSEAENRFKKRRQSSGFLKALFFGIAAKFGAKTRNRPLAGGEAANFTAHPATDTIPRASFETGLVEISAIPEVEPGLRKAAAEATADMMQYAQRKMNEAAERHSGRRTRR